MNMLVFFSTAALATNEKIPNASEASTEFQGGGPGSHTPVRGEKSGYFKDEEVFERGLMCK
jgi:hypothetical protein